MSARRRASARRAAPRRSYSRRRLSVLAGGLLLGYAALLGRATQLQAIDNDELAERARAQAETTLLHSPLRGEIRDRYGTPIAVSATVESVAASPARMPDRRRAARELARALGEPRSRIESRLDPRRTFSWVKRWASDAQARRVRALGLDGVHLHPERRRFYPKGDLAGPYLGFADRDGRGLAGLELRFDRQLSGAEAAVPARRDGRGAKLLARAPDPKLWSGEPVTLALDARLQHFAERALERALERSGARHGTLVALDPRTGEILVIAEVPTFDPNRFWLARPELFRARAFVDTFEPGSTLKPFVIAIALESGYVDPDDRFDCEQGAWRVHDRIIHDPKPHGVMNVRDIMRVSSNIGAAKIADRLGSEKLVAGLRRFGFGERSGSGFPGESAGRLRALREAQGVERANLAFGHGLSVTAVQLASATATLANGGRRVVPRLRRSSDDATPPVGAGEPVVSRRTARLVREMMQEVVERGTGRAAALPHHTVAGKTGTAQKVVDGKYSSSLYVASFVGMVPAVNPRLVFAVVLDEPDRAHSGGAVAAPVFREVASFAVQQLGIPAEVAAAAEVSAAAEGAE